MNLLLGYTPKEPVRIIPNAVDNTIFYSSNKSAWDRSRKTRLISSAWADNVRKGYATHNWLDNIRTSIYLLGMITKERPLLI